MAFIIELEGRFLTLAHGCPWWVWDKDQALQFARHQDAELFDQFYGGAGGMWRPGMNMPRIIEYNMDRPVEQSG